MTFIIAENQQMNLKAQKDILDGDPLVDEPLKTDWPDFSFWQDLIIFLESLPLHLPSLKTKELLDQISFVSKTSSPNISIIFTATTAFFLGMSISYLPTTKSLFFSGTSEYLMLKTLAS